MVQADTQAESVYQMNISLFPVSNPAESMKTTQEHRARRALDPQGLRHDG